MALSEEQKRKIGEMARKRIRDGKAPLTPEGRAALLKKLPPANKLPV